MFIPINAKADIVGSKKGKVSPAQNAQINAWTLAKKTGILNTLGKCIASASTPVGNEVTVTFDSGYFVVCGRVVEVEQGTTVSIPLPASGTVTGRIVARFDLSASQEAEFQVLATTEQLVQEDLNINTAGRYDFVLYGYSASSNGVTLNERSETIYINDVAGNLQNFENSLYGYGKPLYGYNNSLGTIEQRLTRLGFRTGSANIAGISGTALTKVGKYAILKIPYAAIYLGSGGIANGYLSFRSAETFYVDVPANLNVSMIDHPTIQKYVRFSFTAGSSTVTITGEGTNPNSSGVVDISKTQIGFEIELD